MNQFTKETQWDAPTHPAKQVNTDQVQCLHILKKHNKSRRPASWRCDNITQSKETAIMQIQSFREQLINLQRSNGNEDMRELFERIAGMESDCSSAQKGGDLGLFGRGQMQKSFEDASFALQLNEISDLVDSDSGIHIILRIK